MNALVNRYFIGLLVCLGISVGYLIATMPALTDYYYGADEGMYYRQAKAVSEHGVSGYRTVADSYINNENEHFFPHPLRAGHIALASLFVGFNDSIASLSYLSLLAFIVLCIASFFFVKKHWDEQTALMASLLICFSPLGMGMARRALMDAEVYLFISLSLFAFINYITDSSRRNFIFFLAALTFSLLIKETTVLLMPFYCIALFVAKLKEERTKVLKNVVLTGVVPVVVSGVVYLLLLGGFERVFKVVEIVLNTSVFLDKPFAYVTNYMSGPWYQYFIDYFIMSPIVSILFFLSAGYYLSIEKKDITLRLLLGFFVWSVLSLSFLSKDIRYAINLDLIYRIFAALVLVFFIKKFSANELSRVVTVASIVVIIYLDCVKFNTVFLTSKIYDPIAFNLLVAEKFIPQPAPAAAQTQVNTADKTEKLLQELQSNPTPESYLELSLTFYRAGNYENCIRAAEKALELKPDFADAYNNIGSAYIMLKEYDKGIEACEKALQLRPDYQLARNNLNWALSEKNALKK